MLDSSYCVYIITNKTNTTLYIGMTGDLVKRIWQHRKKLVEGFSSRYNLTKLVYYDVYDDPMSAIEREKGLKNLVRRKKDALINNFNPDWRDLYPDIV